MAKYAHDKFLKKAKPKTRKVDGVVMEWDIEVVYVHTRADGSKWRTSYEHREDVEYMETVAEDWSKEELIDLMPSNLSNVIFDAHYDSQNVEAEDETDDKFDLKKLKTV